jgi:hypothetical protein
MKYLLVESVKEEKKRGILNEYEINSQFNSVSYNLSNHHQRLSCSSNGNGNLIQSNTNSAFGYMFQNSVKKMCKNLNNNPQHSSSGSSSKASSTSSSSTSLACQSSNPIVCNNKQPVKHQQHSSNDLLHHNQIHQPSVVLQSSPPTITVHSNHHQSNTLTKNNVSDDSHNHLSPSSSPVSTHSSSSSSNTSLTTTAVTATIVAAASKTNQQQQLIQTHKIQEMPNSKLVSIHELITTKPSSLQTQQCTMVNNKSNRNSNASSSSVGSIHEQFLGHHQQQQTFASETSTSEQWKMNEFMQNRKIQENLTKKCNEVSNVFNNTVNKMPIAKQHASNNGSGQIPQVSQQYKQQPVSNQQHHVMYDESLNPIVMFNNQSETNFVQNHHHQQQHIINRPNSGSKNQQPVIYRSNSQEYLHRFHHSQQNNEQQQIWIPREDNMTVGGVENNINESIMMDDEGMMMDDDPTAFTIKRHLIQLQEEQKQVELLKRIIEQKLKVQLPQVSSVDELGVALADGVILCHLMNQIFPRAIQIIHVPSLALVIFLLIERLT